MTSNTRLPCLINNLNERSVDTFFKLQLLLLTIDVFHSSLLDSHRAFFSLMRRFFSPKYYKYWQCIRDEDDNDNVRQKERLNEWCRRC